MKKRAPHMTTAHQAMRKQLRQVLHDQLDALLNGLTEEAGVEMLVLDSMTTRALQGFGFNVSVDSLHPQGTVKMPKPTVQQGAPVGLVREEGKR